MTVLCVVCIVATIYVLHRWETDSRPTCCYQPPAVDDQAEEGEAPEDDPEYDPEGE